MQMRCGKHTASSTLESPQDHPQDLFSANTNGVRMKCGARSAPGLWVFVIGNAKGIRIKYGARNAAEKF